MTREDLSAMIVDAIERTTDHPNVYRLSDASQAALRVCINA